MGKYIITDYTNLVYCVSDYRTPMNSKSVVNKYSEELQGIIHDQLLTKRKQLIHGSLFGSEGISENPQLPDNALANIELDNKINQFKEAIKKVCDEHQLCISHEDYQGAFLITDYSQGNLDWLLEANYETT